MDEKIESLNDLKNYIVNARKELRRLNYGLMQEGSDAAIDIGLYAGIQAIERAEFAEKHVIELEAVIIDACAQFGEDVEPEEYKDLVLICSEALKKVAELEAVVRLVPNGEDLPYPRWATGEKVYHQPPQEEK